MKMAELREKSVKELQSILSDANAEHFKHMLGLRSNQLKETHLVRDGRRQIARIKTVLNEKHYEDIVGENAPEVSAD
jgi:large subunit ribosomal protein L29